MDDLCRSGQTLCGATFCEDCGTPCLFDALLCDECREALLEAKIEEDAQP